MRKIETKARRLPFYGTSSTWYILDIAGTLITCLRCRQKILLRKSTMSI